MRIIVLGYLVRGPIGGLAWHHLQYVMGLSALGHDVYFVETTDGHRCYDPNKLALSTDASYGLKFADAVFRRIDLGDRWAYYDDHAACWLGPSGDDIVNLGHSADIVLNLSGVNSLDPWFADVPVRVLVDTDPAFTQIRHLSDPGSNARAQRHTAFFSFGENICTGHSKVPPDGFAWQSTRQPIVLDAWPVTAASRDSKLTTVMQWDSYKSVRYEGRHYGMKSLSFKPLVDLPEKSHSELELVIGSESAPVSLLKENGWHIRDPIAVSKDPWTYQRYIQNSRAEFSVAKHGYVFSKCGWFSERSAAYLASGRPVITQDTGFSDWLNVDRGVIPFNNPHEAVIAIDNLNASYDEHQKASRELAAEYFEASKVLSRLLDSAMSSSTPRKTETHSDR